VLGRLEGGAERLGGLCSENLRSRGRRGVSVMARREASEAVIGEQMEDHERLAFVRSAASSAGVMKLGI